MTHSANIVQWVPVRGASAALMMTELRVANDLSNMVPLPHSKAEPARPPSPKIIRGVPARAKSDTDSSVIDFRDKWDKMEVSVWQRCLTPTAKIGPIWAEVHATAHEEEMFQKQDSTWKDIINRQSSGGMEEDWGMKEDSQYAAEPQFEDATIEEEDEEEVAGEPPTEELGEDTVDHRSQDVVADSCWGG